jgi:NADPH:quinone reductase-like Zn-dependent oxidoreductase
MRAVVAEKMEPTAGDLSFIDVKPDQPVPTLEKGQVLIRVNASSVNPVDWKIVEPGQGFGPVFHYPHILGFDVAGIVESCQDCTRLKVGDEVWADVGKFWPLKGGELGAYAEFAVADEAQVGIKPQSLTFVEAASLPLAALTSYQAFVKSGDLTNKTVMVTSGSGGTGFVGVQLAKALGATKVISVTSAENIPFVKECGADKVYDYTKGDVWSQLPADSLDVVYDNYGASGTADKAMPKIRTGGVFIFLPGKGGGESKNPKKGVRQINFGLCDSSSYKDLDVLSGFISKNQVRPHIQQVFPLEQIKLAFNTSMAGQVVGKLAVQI